MGWLELLNQEPEAETTHDAEIPSATVLIIDDEVPITDTLSKYLGYENYQVLVANDGNEGWEKYRQQSPDIILTDIRMPGMSGLDLLKKIRAEDKEIEIIVVTGHGDLDIAIDALKNQASDFILKPLDFEVILLSLERAIERLNLKRKVKDYTDELEKLLKEVKYSKAYLQAIVQNSPNALVSYDEFGVVNSWNDEAVKVTGYPKEEAIGKKLAEIFAFEGPLIEPHGMAEEQQMRKNVIAQILTHSGQMRFISRNANVLKNEDGRIAGGIESFRDVTEQLKNDSLLEKRYLQVQTINEIGKKVASSNNLDELCTYISDHLYKTFLESSQITLLLFDAQHDNLILRALAGQSVERIKENFDVGSIVTADKGVIGKAIQTGRPVIICDVSDEFDFSPLFYDDVLSQFAFPIRSKDKVFGVLNIENAERIKPDESDQFMLEAIAEYLGISIERIELLEKITQQNQLLEKQASDLKSALHKVESQKAIIEEQNSKLIQDLKKAGEFQKSLLPEKLPEFNVVHFAATYVPSSQLGGDIYDVFAINEELVGVILADASGHGVAAAMLSAMFKMTLQKYAFEVLEPGQVLQKLNVDFCRVLQMGEFFTGFYAIINIHSREIVYSNAGHPKPLLYNYNTSQVTALDTDGFLLGVMDVGITYEQKEQLLSDPCRLLIYTDGVNEAVNKAGVQFGDDRIRDCLVKYAFQDPAVFLDQIRDDLTSFTESDSFEDDITMVIMDIN